MKFDILFRNGLDYQHNRKDLTSYFFREFKKAERDNFYTVETFFPPLYDRIERHKEGIKKNFESKKEDLQKLLQKAKKNEKDHYDPYYSKCIDRQGINYEDFKKQENKKTVKNTQKELNNFTPESVISQPLLGFKLSEIRLLEENIKEAENKLKPKKEKEKLELKDFFTEQANPGLIKAIQERFKDFRNKQMAILIYLLHKKYNLITYDLGDRKKNSRKHFVEALTQSELKNINGINNFFDSVTAETKVDKRNEAFLNLDKQLMEIVSNG